MPSRRIEDLDPIVQPLAKQLVGVKFGEWESFITCTYRTIEEQNVLYAQGRTRPGAIVTNAKGGDSIHNYRCAFDIAFKNVKGQVSYNPTLFTQLAPIGRKIGLEWGGDWITFPDKPHFQYTQGLTLADFKSGKKLKSTVSTPDTDFIKSLEGKFLLAVEDNGSLWEVLNGKRYKTTVQDIVRKYSIGINTKNLERIPKG